MSFNIGQRVICVYDDFLFTGVLKLYESIPIKGRTYTIRDVRIGIEPDCRTGAVSVLLEGIVNPHSGGRSKLERGFDARRFKEGVE